MNIAIDTIIRAGVTEQTILNFINSFSLPIKIDDLDGAIIVAIAVGAKRMAALDNRGNIWASANGELFKKIKFINDRQID